MIITKEIYGEHHVAVAEGYNNLGFVYGILGQYSEAKEYYERALIILKEICGDEHALGRWLHQQAVSLLSNTPFTATKHV